MSKIICLDPGHGGSDSGACKGTRKEKTDALKMALAVGKLLTSQGIKVIYTRTTDKDITIAERTTLSNNAKADYFLSIHRNSATASAKGYEIWIHSEASSTTSNKAKAILNNVVAVDGRLGVNRGVKKGAPSYSNFGINRLSNAPSALFEMGFISNKDDNKYLDNKFNQIAEAIAKGLCSAVGVSYKKATEESDMKYLQQIANYKGIKLASNCTEQQALEAIKKFDTTLQTQVNDYNRQTRTMKEGDSNNAVFAVKCLILELKRLGVINQGVDANGVFGGGTVKAVKLIQEKAGLKQTGEVDANTIRAIDTLLSKVEPKVITKEVTKEITKEVLSAENKNYIKVAMNWLGKVK